MSWGVTALFAALVGRVAWLQIAPGEQLRAHTVARESGVRLRPDRGRLLDRRGRVLATSETHYRVIVDPELLPVEPGAVFVDLARVLDEPADKIGQRVFSAVLRNDEARAEAVASAPDAEHAKGWVGTLRAALAPEHDPPTPEGLVRYVRVSEPVPAAVADRVRELGLQGVYLEAVEQRLYPAGDAVASIVGRAGPDPLERSPNGWLGAEKRWEDRLEGEAGRGGYVRDHLGRPLWVEKGSWSMPRAGADLHLSLDLELQRIALEELDRGVKDANAAGGRVIVMDPSTGEILAMGDVYRDVPEAIEYPWMTRKPGEEAWTPGPAWTGEGRPRYRVIRDDPNRRVLAALGRNRCVEDVYEPGSTFKPFVWSEAMRLGLLKTAEQVETFNNAYGLHGRVLRDVTPRDSLTWDEVLVYSSNIGMVQASMRLSEQQLRSCVLRYGFGRSTGTGLPGETSGIVTSERNWNVHTQISMAMGYEIGVTPVQMARAFCVFARRDTDAGTLPEARLTAAVSVGHEAYDDMPVIVERVLPAEIAMRARGAMARVVGRLDGLNKRRFGDDPDDPAGWNSYAMFGKSGTAEIPCVPPTPLKDGTRFRRPPGADGYYVDQYNCSFIAAAPAAGPRLVVLVVIDDPGPELVAKQHYYGSWTAGPVVRRIVERGLRYMGVPPETGGVASGER